MAFRKLLLRVMLWSLALAAVCGVLAVLFSGHETAWRVVGTMVVTAVAAGLMMWMSMLSEKERTREAGLLGMGVLVMEWVLAEALIWDVRAAFGASYRLEESLAFTMLFAVPTAVWAMLALGVRRRKGFEVAAVFGLVVAGVVAALWGLALWWPTSGSGWLWGRSLLTANLGESAWAVAALGAVATVLLLDSATRRWWVWVGMGCAAVALAMWLAAIWMEIHESNGTAECIASVAIVGAFWNVLRLVRLRDAQQWVVWGTMVVGAATALLLDVVIVMDKQHADVDLLGRMAAAGGILVGCGTLAIVILSRLNRHDVAPAEMPAVTEMIGVCPVCQKKQKLKVGEAKCEACGVIIEIKVKEPRCPQCNYLLLMLKSNRCPECGASV